MLSRMDFVRTRVFLLLALAIAAVLAAGSAFALINADDEPALTLPTAAPTTSLSPLATPSPTASPTPSATPTATPTSSPTPTATRTATPTSSPTAVKTYAYPSPSHRYDSLRMSGTLSQGLATVGTNIELTVNATDGDGTIYLTQLSWGDGTSDPAQPSPRHCKSWPTLHSPPGAYRPEPDTFKAVAHHRWVTPGDYTVTVTVTSVNADCKPHGPATERATVQIPIRITA